MKLRVRGNSLRLRLEQHEIRELIRKGKVAESLAFGQSNALGYTLAMSQKEGFNAGITGGELLIEVPVTIARKWGESEEVGIYKTINEGSAFEIKLAIEKDFQCLHKRPEEDESDLFPNPKAGS